MPQYSWQMMRYSPLRVKRVLFVVHPSGNGHHVDIGLRNKKAVNDIARRDVERQRAPDRHGKRCRSKREDPCHVVRLVGAVGQPAESGLVEGRRRRDFRGIDLLHPRRRIDIVRECRKTDEPEKNDEHRDAEGHPPPLVPVNVHLPAHP